MSASKGFRGRRRTCGPDHSETHVNELLVLQVQELVKLDTSVSVLLEGTLPLELGGLSGVGESGISLCEARVKKYLVFR